MYAGKVVETGSVLDVLRRPEHPYTQGLLASMPRLDREDRRLTRIAGQPPSLIEVPAGCAFHPRCPYALVPDPCAAAGPELRPVAGGEHLAACHFSGRLTAAGPGGAALVVKP
jgi:peptide/nickel transport system ATP-binding protein